MVGDKNGVSQEAKHEAYFVERRSGNSKLGLKWVMFRARFDSVSIWKL